MSAADMRELIHYASKWAEQAFARCGCVVPLWHAIQSNGEHMILSSEEFDDKEQAVSRLRAMFEERDVVTVLFIAEAWSAVAHNEAEWTAVQNWMKQHGCLKDYPNRIEIVAITVEDQSGGMLTAYRVIDRKGCRPRLGPLKIEDQCVSEGRMVGMLPRGARTLQ